MRNPVTRLVQFLVLFLSYLLWNPSVAWSQSETGTRLGTVSAPGLPLLKKIDPAWMNQLPQRGEPEVYRGSELKYIGMPVGGFFTGQLYLGGDGRLWHWDIFNANIFSGYNGEHYSRPLVPSPVLEQEFHLKIGDRTLPLSSEGFHDVSFRGEYPVGIVRYKDASVPISVTLETFSPMIPHNTADSSLPATVLRFTLTNSSSTAVDATLSGSLENGVARQYLDTPGVRSLETVRDKSLTFLSFTAAQKQEQLKEIRPDVLFEEWKGESYEGWKAEGTAFGSGPIKKTKLVAVLGDVGGDTTYVVNSHGAAPGSTVVEKDSAQGTLTSRPFVINRKYLLAWLGGGNHPGKTGLNVLVDGKMIASATGKSKNVMFPTLLNLSAHEGQRAVIEIIDHESGAWGNVGVGRLLFTDQNLSKPFEQLDDYGSMGLALLGDGNGIAPENKTVALREKLVGELGQRVKLAPGQSTTITFAVTWFFPNLQHLPKLKTQGRSYAKTFDSALAVARYLNANEKRLVDETFRWKQTWYDSTLPYWFLDRTFINTSTLATSTCYRLKDDRFWAWEGVGSCAGTCGHVWYYGQSIARLFPDIERDQREKVDFDLSQEVDFDLSQDPQGAIRFRGENNNIPAIDAQAGYILRALREHQMSPDNAFLQRIWPRVKLAMDWMIAKDGTNSGMIHGNQHNTLDKDWYGEVSWLSGLYQAALLASAEMADTMKDSAYAAQCRKLAESGKTYLTANLFNGEYYVNKVDPNRLQEVNSGSGCHIDQVMGQSWAFQVGLPRVFPREQTLKSLQSLWRYNFTTDVGPFREANKPGRWYARAGEAGLIMCTFPRSDWDYDKAAGKAEVFQKMAAGYFNECMNGFEHQVASHMIWEGMVSEGLAIERAVHERYAAAKRNPYNEIECGDHYGRSMASYGVYLAACGFQYDGPKGIIGFAPRLTPDNFKAAFTAAEGWGTFSQTRTTDSLKATVDLKYGRLVLQSISLQPQDKQSLKNATVRILDKPISATLKENPETHAVIISFAEKINLTAGQTLTVQLNR